MFTSILVVCCTTIAYAQDFSINQNQYDPYNNPYTSNRSPYDQSFTTSRNPFINQNQGSNLGDNPYGQSTFDQGTRQGQFDQGQLDQNRQGQFDQNRQGQLDQNRQGQFDQNRQGQFDQNRQTQYDQNRQNQFDPTYQYGKQDQYSFTQRPRTFDYGVNRNQIDHSTVIREASYFIVASKMVRPGQLYRVSVTVLQEQQPLTIRASIQRNGVEVTSDHKDVKMGIPETLLMKVIYLFNLKKFK